MTLTRNENLFLAKKMFAEMVYNTAYIEGCNVTFPQTQTILDGAIINNVSVDDIQTVLNLRDAWKHMLNNIDDPLDLTYICKINEHVSRNESLEWGVLRYGEISVSGTSYIPEIPNQEAVIRQLEIINSISDAKERAKEYFCYAVKNQLFWDGNKRTSTIVANKILIENGQGILTIDKNIAEEFNTTLTDYYEFDKKEPLKKCLEKAIKGLNIKQSHSPRIKK
jgi:prophage maintenance system killer protein